MTNLKTQKRLASDILGCGEDRVWFDPNSQDDISEAITRDEIKDLIDEGKINRKPKKGVSRGRARKHSRQGPGSRKGKKGARSGKKKEWISKIRALRKELKKMREEDEITPSQYRKLYRKAKGGEFNSIRQMKGYKEKRL